MRLIARCIALFLFLGMSISYSYANTSLVHCIIRGGCPSTSPEPVQVNNPIADDRRLSVFRTQRIDLIEGTTDRRTGYVRASFNFVGADGVYTDFNDRVEQIFDRNFGWWFRHFFQDEKSVFMITLEILEGETVVWAVPVLAVDQRETFNVIEVNSSLNLSDRMDFWMPSNANVRAVIKVRRTRDVDFNTDRIVSLFRLAENVSGALARVASPVLGFQLSTDQRESIREIVDEFNEFEEIDQLTVRTRLDATTAGQYEGVSYHFLAANRRPDVTKLLVNLEYTSSLLSNEALQDITSTQVLDRTQNTPEPLLDFINTDPAARRAYVRSTGYEDVVVACFAIREALNRVFRSHDVPLALNALLFQNTPGFAGDFDDRCFLPGEAATISDYNFPVFGARETRDREAVSIDSDDLHAFAIDMIVLLTGSPRIPGQPDLTSSNRRAIAFDDEDNRREFNLIDNGLFLGGSEIGPEPVIGTSFANDLLRASIDSYGCFSRVVHDPPPSEENKYSFLVVEEGNITEIVMDFANTTVEGTTPELLEMTLNPRSIEQAGGYRAAGTSTCQNWSIWSTSTAS